jgi:hypothetical protein
MEKLGIPTTVVSYADMESVVKKTSLTKEVALPNVRIVIDATRGTGGEKTAQTVTGCVKALTSPLTDKEKFAGEFKLPPEPRILFTGTYEDAMAFLEGDLSRFTQTAAVAEYTDGSPVRLPTEEAVARMLKGTSHKPDEVVGPLLPSKNPATVEVIAANAVMAGCKPEQMPVLLALTEAMVHTDIAEALFGASGWFRFGAVINGPIARELGINTGGPGLSGPAPLTPGVPANTSISRFIRLIMRNIGEIVPGGNEAKGIGNPAKTGFVVAEATDESPWPQLSTDWGFKDKENTVTFFVFWGDMLAGVRQAYTGPASEKTIVANLGNLVEGAKGLSRSQQGLVMCISPAQAQALADAGYSRQDVKKWVSDHCVDPYRKANQMGLGTGVVGTLFNIQGKPLNPTGNWPPEWKDPKFDPNTIVKYYPNPEGITIVVFPSASYSMIMNGTPRWTVAIDKWR